MQKKASSVFIKIASFFSLLTAFLVVLFAPQHKNKTPTFFGQDLSAHADFSNGSSGCTSSGSGEATGCSSSGSNGCNDGSVDGSSDGNGSI